jgi:assimilatory nitrate reductase catalytic subunit
VRSLFEAGVVAERDRRILLSGRSSDGLAETGPVICACYSVGLAAIRKAIATGEAASVADIGRTLRAGTNCGSCVAELRTIIEDMAKIAETRADAKPSAVPVSA